MPELPEVETTRRGIAPHVVGTRLSGWVVRDARLRWPVELPPVLRGEPLMAVRRRAKYLILELPPGGIVVHLGMSGSLRVVSGDAAPGKHDHVDLCLETGLRLRLTDPRRFGSVHFAPAPWSAHRLLAGLGPEPDSSAFTGAYLFRRSRGRRTAVKSYLMDSRTVAGVGNIYANEALFRAGIRPRVAAGRIGLARYERLAESIRETLQAAIRLGGTTLRDFVGGDGQPGYFSQTLNVYGREGLPCRQCARILVGRRHGQRATVYCPACQQ
jgi:formamidopyrimidine-DNA glycosylase